jgi:hypothetical protein
MSAASGSGGVSGAATSTGGASSDGATGTGGAAGGVSGSGSGAGGAGGGGALCGGDVCGQGMECCGPSACGYCIGIGTDPACASECPSRPCGDQGLECLERVLGFPGEVCVRKDVSGGPMVTTTYGCVRNPCTGALGCSEPCALALCATPNTGPSLTCAEADPETLGIRCTGGSP